MEMTKNANSAEVSNSWWIFYGWWMYVPFGSAALFSIIAFIGSGLGLSFPMLMLIGISMFFLPACFVVLFVNDRPRNYVIDIANLWIFQTKCFLYMKGFLDRPPCLWAKAETPDYPR